MFYDILLFYFKSAFCSKFTASFFANSVNNTTKINTVNV